MTDTSAILAEVRADIRRKGGWMLIVRYRFMATLESVSNETAARYNDFVERKVREHGEPPESFAAAYLTEAKAGIIDQVDTLRAYKPLDEQWDGKGFFCPSLYAAIIESMYRANGQKADADAWRRERLDEIAWRRENEFAA